VTARAVTGLAMLALTGIAAGCGGGKKDEAAKPPPLVPPAKTQAEWANRLANRFFISIERDLRVVNLLSRPDLLIYLYQGNEQTVSAVKARMNDLELCSYKLARVGPPPPSKLALRRVHSSLEAACEQYEKMAEIVLDAVPLLSSSDPAKKKRGEQLFARASPPSKLAAVHYGRAIRTIDKDPVLRDLVLLGPSG
jgi:hypothetical protein